MMQLRATARAGIEGDLERLQRDHVLVLHLDDLVHLVSDPPDDPFLATRSLPRAGVEELAATLAASRRLPPELTVNVVRPAGAAVEPSVAVAEAALQRRAAFLASAAWREGMALRAEGRSQSPFGYVIAVGAWVTALGAVVIAANSEGLIEVLCILVEMVCIMVAWSVSWMVIESSLLAWRRGARQACAYELLSRARLQVTFDQP